MSAFTWQRSGLRSGWGPEAARVTARGHCALTVSFPRVLGRGSPAGDVASPRGPWRPSAAVRSCCRPGNRVGFRVPGRRRRGGWARPGWAARETKPLGNGRDLALPAAVRARARGVRGGGVQGEHRGFRPPTRDARGSEAASQLPWEGCPYSSSGASVARSQPGGNRTCCLWPQAAPLSRQPMRAPFCPPPCPPPGASRQLGAGPAARPR